MDIEERLASLEARVQASEDQLEILRLLNTYGPLVDSASGAEAAALWVDGGGYDYGGGSDYDGGRLSAPDELAAMYGHEPHTGLVNRGVSHLTATPRITVDGDTAVATGYSYVVVKEDDRWIVWRAAINHWTLARTPEGWRIVERLNRTLDGTESSREIMRRVIG